MMIQWTSRSAGLTGLVMSLLMSGCASVGSPVTGLIYSDLQFPRAVTGLEAGNRTGEACATTYLYLVAFGDSSIEAARRNGGINSISSIDQTYRNYGPFYAQSCVIVRGK